MLEAILQLFAKGDRLLKVLSDYAEASVERREVLHLLLRGNEIPFEGIIDPHNDLAEEGLLHSEHRLLRFSTRLYERVTLNRRFPFMTPPYGKYLFRKGTLFTTFSEIQRAVVNSDLRKAMNPHLQGPKGETLEHKVHRCKEILASLDSEVLRGLDCAFIRGPTTMLKAEPRHRKSSSGTIVTR